MVVLFQFFFSACLTFAKKSKNDLHIVYCWKRSVNLLSIENYMMGVETIGLDIKMYVEILRSTISLCVIHVLWLFYLGCML